jgi:hypothetical protein
MPSKSDDMRAEYDFSDAVRGKYYHRNEVAERLFDGLPFSDQDSEHRQRYEILAALAEERRLTVERILDEALVALHLSEHPDVDYESCAICPDFRLALRPLRAPR